MSCVSVFTKTDRGGKLTYHGPGQRIVYPIIDLTKYKKDIKLYVRMLETWVIEALNVFDIKGSADKE